MATIICSNCSEIITVDGRTPRSCPKCGFTLDIAGDATHTHERRPEHLGGLPETIIEALNSPFVNLGRYEVESRLGSGGFGTVYLARDPKLDRLVALKVPEPGRRQNREAVERFAREGRNAAQLRHPGIVSVFTVEEDQGLVFIVSEYVEGETLAAELKRERPSFRNAASLVAAIATAVDYAHSKGIVHRDIKPSNIMIDRAGNPRLMDFGLAKREEIDPTITHEHQVMGTPAYMSPEQAKGSPEKIDRRTDVYSLGAVLYHLLTHELPFQGDSHAVRHKVIDDEPARLRAIDKKIPLDLETVCLKAMEKDPAKRYPTAKELADDLERWLRGEPILARHIGSFERGWRWCRRNPAPAGLIASVALLLTTWAVGSSVMAGMAEAGRREAVGREVAEAKARDVAEKGRDQEMAARKREAELRTRETAARQKAEIAQKQIAEALVRNQELLSRSYVEKGSRYVRAPELSEEYAPMRALPWYLEAMKLDANNRDRLAADQTRLQTGLALAPRVERLWFIGGRAQTAGISPQRDVFYSAVSDGSVKLWRIGNAGAPIASLVHPAAVPGAAFSPDAKLLATRSPDGVRIWQIESARLLCGPLVPHRARTGSGRAPIPFTTRLFSFSQTGQFLVAAAFEGGIQTWKVRTGEPLGPPTDTRLHALSAEFANSDRLLVLTCTDGTVHVHDVGAGVERSVLRTAGEQFKRAILAPDGLTLAVFSNAPGVSLWNLATGKQTARLTTTDWRMPANCAVFSPDGKLLSAASDDGSVRTWMAADGKLLWQRQTASGTVDLKFSPDGSTLAVINNHKKLSIVTARTGKAIAQPIYNPLRLTHAEWVDPSGRILTVDANGIARLWSVEPDIVTLMLPHSSGVRYAIVSGDRRVLATADEKAVSLLRLPGAGHLQPDVPKTFQIANSNIDAIALTDDGTRLAISSDRQVTIWDTSIPKQLTGPFTHTNTVGLMRFTPNGSLLVCVSKDGHVTVWNALTGNRLSEPLDIHRLVSADLDFDRDARRCAVVAMQGVATLDLSTGKPDRPGVLGRPFPRFARFLREPNSLLIAGNSQPTQVWNSGTDKPAPMPPKPASPQCVAVSDDRSLFLTGYEDGHARLWFSHNALPASPPFEHASPLRAAIMSPDARWVATLTQNSHVFLWDARTGELLAAVSLQSLEPQIDVSDRPAASSRPLLPLFFFSADARWLHLVTETALFATIELEPARASLKKTADQIAVRCGAQYDGMGDLRILDAADLAPLGELQPQADSAARPAGFPLDLKSATGAHKPK